LFSVYSHQYTAQMRRWLFVLIACSCNEPELAWTPSEAQARFQVGPLGVESPVEVPFPSDLLLDDSGRVPTRLGSWTGLGVTSNGSTLTGGLAGLDGFGRSVGAFFRIEGEAIDPASLECGVSVFLLEARTGTAVPCEARFVAATRTVTVQPDRVVLASGTRYAVVLTRGVLTTTGAPLRPSAELVMLLNGRLEVPFVERMTSVLSVLERVGLSRSRIAGLTVFTTTTRHRVLRATRDALVAGRFGPAPRFLAGDLRFGATPHPGWTSTLDAWMGTAPRDGAGRELPGYSLIDVRAGQGIAHDGIGAILSGTMTTPEFRRPFTGTASPADGTIALDPSGVASPSGAMASVPVTFVFPKRPPPPTGWPVVIYGHGTPVHRQHVFGIANALAEAGFVVVTMDAPEHGLRAPGARDATTLFAGSYRGPDGLADDVEPTSTALAAMGNLVNLARARDTRAQTIFEYVELVRALKDSQVDLSAIADAWPGVTPRLDVRRIAWLGVSFGGINGMILGAVEPELHSFALVVGGGLEFATIGESPANNGFAALAMSSFGFDPSQPFSRFHPALLVGQTIFDPVDAALFGADFRRDANVFALQVDHDELVPNIGSEVVLREMGIPQLPGPVRWSSLAAIDAPMRDQPARAALLQPIGVHGRNLLSRVGTRSAKTPFPDAEGRIEGLSSPVTVRQPIVETQRAVIDFLRSAQDGAAVIDPGMMPMWFDFDDDGWPDDEERKAGHDPFDPRSVPPGMAPRPR
jgi:dienelactone hydrolase